MPPISEIEGQAGQPEVAPVQASQAPSAETIAEMQAKLAAALAARDGQQQQPQASAPEPAQSDLPVDTGGAVDLKAAAEVVQQAASGAQAATASLDDRAQKMLEETGKVPTQGTLIADTRRVTAGDEVVLDDGTVWAVWGTVRGEIIVHDEDGNLARVPVARAATSGDHWQGAQNPARVAADAQQQRPAQQAPAQGQEPQQQAPGRSLSGQAQARPPAVQQAQMPVVGGALADDDDLTDLFRQHAGRGLDFTADQMIVPRLVLLQDNSPQVKEGTMGYVPGARPGMLMNSVSKELAGRVLMIPVKLTTRFVAWRPRDEKGGGGGLIAMDVGEKVWDQLDDWEIGRRLMAHEKGRVLAQGGVPVAEVVRTPEWACLMSMDNGVTFQPAAIDMAGTKAKSAGKIATLLNMQTEVGPNGEEFPLAIYSSIIDVRAKREGEGSESYFTYDLSFHNRLRSKRLFNRAAALFAQFRQGDVEVAPMMQG